METIKCKVWLTDRDFGYEHWQASEYPLGRGTHHAIILRFDSEADRDEYLARLNDEAVKVQLLEGGK